MKSATRASAIATWVAAISSLSVHAADELLLEPGLRMSWSFGHTQLQSLPSLRLGLYPNDIGWQRMTNELGLRELGTTATKPAMLDLELIDQPDLIIMGMPLKQTADTLAAAEGEEGGISWGWIAGGVAVGVLGLAAYALSDLDLDEGVRDTFTPGPQPDDDDDTDGGGILCLGDQCVLPCGTTGPINSCTGD